ncbi:hypothetical protein [Candidatus Protochlamydia amoebophila]|uniref:Uncharacterized protein n=1 Tax=Protochlamydia amoebophila (strain UWE25) TaxID=264201 RepID=Q6MF69_PARUW|nr:hypothetical protein [Candidatus Protochlamydia amoebophila]CAF22780.1 unnamed protein product [Candidatus Protochlamydia amoebophila UWE25]
MIGNTNFQSVTDLQSITEGAYRIYGCLTDGQFNYKKAIQESNNLYQEGVQLAIAEVNTKPIIEEIVSPVVCTLNDIVSLGSTQHLVSFHQSLSKTYRIFIELTWYRCWCQGSLPTLNETRDTIMENSKRILSVLPKKEIGARFEYRCAEQAAKCLVPVKSIWKKFCNHLLNIGESAEGVSFFGVIKGFQELNKDVKKDWLQAWYPYIHELRWLSANIKTQEDFENIIETKLEEFQEKGKKYTVCLALIFVDLIKNPEVTENVRKLAAKGLADLFLLKDQDRLSTLTEFALEKFPQVKLFQKTVKNEDRYWKTRSLIMQSLEELSKDDAHKDYIQDTLKSLVKVQNESIHIEEKNEIQKSLKILKEDHEEFQKAIEEDLAILAAKKGKKQRGEGDIEKLEAKLENDLEEKGNVERDLEAMHLVEKALEELHEEEQEYENRLAVIWNSYNQ